jgi:O-antigen/teichoic acid export membrane protein
MSLKLGITRLSIASVSPLCVFALRFVRTIILSHMLAPNNLGAAVALMTILAGCEMVLDVGLDRFVVVTSGKDRAQAVAVAQQIALGRAIFLAAAIALFSHQLAGLFGAGDELKGVAWLGLVPLIFAFRNWRLIQIQQDYRYGPEAITTVCGQIAGVALVFPAALWFQDERALLVSLMAEAVVHVTLSNILIRREPVAQVDRAMRKAVFKWGLPLMINGVGLMAVKQLDQVFVANLFDLKTLAVYALGINLAITPTAPLQTIGQKLGLPFLGKTKDNPQLARHAALLSMLVAACCAACYALPVGLVLDQLVPLLYGRHYQVSEAFCALAMVVAFLRFCRGGPNLILLHHGLTSRLTVGNMVAGIGTAVGAGLAYWSGRMEGVMVGLVIGDFISLVLLLALLRGHLSVAKAMFHTGVLTAIVGVAAAAIWTTGDFGIAQRVLIFVVGGAVIAFDAAVVFLQVGRDFMPRPMQRAVLNIVPASARPGVAAVAARTEPPV